MQKQLNVDRDNKKHRQWVKQYFPYMPKKLSKMKIQQPVFLPSEITIVLFRLEIRKKVFWGW